jgi:hypothetical protein
VVPGDEPRTLRGLWLLLVREMLVEYKSPSRPPRPYDVAKLIGYGGQLHALRKHEKAILVPSTMLTAEARRWLEEHMPTKDISPDEKLEGHDEVLERLLRSLTPEEILRAAGTERLLSVLPPEQMLLALPDSTLRALSEEYIQTLPAEIQATIRRRIGAARPG